jgi:predicted NBD/HSP70 family sugar kinase
MDALLERSSPALRAWLLTPQTERFAYGTPPLYDYARVYDAAPFAGWRVGDVPLDRLHGADLYASRWGWKRICNEATAQIKALDAATKAYGRAGADPSVDVTFAFLRAYASAIEAISLLHGCTDALDAAIRTVLTTDNAEIVKQTNAMYAKVQAKLSKSGANRTSPVGRLADAIRDAESTVPLGRLTRWYAALLLGSVPPYVRAQLRDLYDALAGRRSYRAEIEPKALAATVKALETALESVQKLWDDYLTALDPEKQGLYGLRLPFGRPPYKGDGALTNRRKLSMEGFDLTFNGEIDVPRVTVDTITERLRPVLVQYKRQSARYFPALTAEFTPHLDIWFYNAFGARTPWGHHYGSGRGIAIYPRNMPWFTAGTPDRADLDKVVQVIAHEAGHHIWNRALNERQRATWTALVTRRVPIDYNAILAAFDAAYGERPWPPPPPPADAGWLPVPAPTRDVTGPLIHGDRWDAVRAAWAQSFDGEGDHVAYDEDGNEPLERLAERVELWRRYAVERGAKMSPVYFKDYVDRGRSARRVAFYRWRAGAPAPTPRKQPREIDGRPLFFLDASVPRGPHTVNDLLPRLREQNPTLAIQIKIASSVYDPDYARKSGASSAWRWMDPDKGDPKPLFWMGRSEIQALRDRQDRRDVPKLPITTYGATNPEESWCDAFGNLMAYGPMTVLEPLRELIYAFFPKIRRNPDDGVDADT